MLLLHPVYRAHIRNEKFHKRVLERQKLAILLLDQLLQQLNAPDAANIP